jgi:Cd2+/Zn2+-exporting ATPase
MILHIATVAANDTHSCGCESGTSWGNSKPGKENSAELSQFFNRKDWFAPVLTAALLLLGSSFQYLYGFQWFEGFVLFSWYLAAWLPVGYPVLLHAVQKVKDGDVFTEFLLMSMASMGAFYIGEYPEGVAVMLFYAVGELFQGGAVRRARANIKALMDIRSDVAHVKRNGRVETVESRLVNIGDIIQVRRGERVPLDGELISSATTVDASALTGESVPLNLVGGDNILSGMVNSSDLIEIKVTRLFENSTVSRILKLVQESSSRKAKTELFIRKFARIYTPIVTLLAVLVITIPYFFVANYVFDDWLYRGLVFLVISCPCALVISIPLGYFGGIGAASRNGILVKGGNYLDALLKINTVVFDKTGTLTHGKFGIHSVESRTRDTETWMTLAASLENKSNHPIAKAIVDQAKITGLQLHEVTDVAEIAGKGLSGVVDGSKVHIGTFDWLKEEGFHVDFIGSEVQTLHLVNGNFVQRVRQSGDSTFFSVTKQALQGSSTGLTEVGVVVDGSFEGIIYLADEIKKSSSQAISALRKTGIKQIIMLSGDHDDVVVRVSREVGITEYKSRLLPEQKADYLMGLKNESDTIFAFVGDGINDAPSIAMADVGIAMGALGSDAAVETADVVLQNDNPLSIVKAIEIARKTRAVVWQNISLAFGVKALVMVLGAMGMASLWEAVFADVGVALLAILNAVRIR